MISGASHRVGPELAHRKGGPVDDRRLVAIIKGLIVDAVARAKSGHPGGAMSSADFAYVLFRDFLAFDPDDPLWMGRDRFVLSAGHESALLYSLLHCVGWLDLDDLKAFRSLHSRTPGHPEVHVTPGVECTTGPLGQGLGMATGMALAQAWHRANTSADLFSGRTVCLVSDGDVQEGVCLAAAALAGHLQLGNLIAYYDKNFQQLSGPLAETSSTRDEEVFRGLGWKVETINGHDHGALRAALARAYTTPLDGAPTLIIGHTTIGEGCATMAGSHKTHGAPLPAEERTKTRQALGLGDHGDFYCPPEALAHFRAGFGQRRAVAADWQERLRTKRDQDAHFAKIWSERFVEAPTPSTWPRLTPPAGGLATRQAFGDVLKAWCGRIGHLVGGSADLEPSNMTEAFAEAVGDFSPARRQGRNINFGVREFPMSAITNGMGLFGGIIPFDATFLAFADYSRPALRLGALQEVRVIHEFTHDSFYLGEDGPTHQPIEQVMSLRMIPNLFTIRPADAVETEELMHWALTAPGPSAFCLSRQRLPLLPGGATHIREGCVRGAYVVRDHADAQLTFLATGSEVCLALRTADQHPEFRARVVSMPCWRLFEAQDPSYQKNVLGHVPRVSIEAGVTLGWERFAGAGGLTLGIDTFGASGPMEDLERLFGFTPEAIAAKIRLWLDTLKR